MSPKKKRSGKQAFYISKMILIPKERPTLESSGILSSIFGNSEKTKKERTADTLQLKYNQSLKLLCNLFQCFSVDFFF